MVSHTQLFIDGQWRKGHGGEAPVINPANEETIGSHAIADQADLEQGRQDVERREADQELHPLGAAFYDPAQAAGLALEVETEAQPMDGNDAMASALLTPFNNRGGSAGGPRSRA